MEILSVFLLSLVFNKINFYFDQQLYCEMLNTFKSRVLILHMQYLHSQCLLAHANALIYARISPLI